MKTNRILALVATTLLCAASPQPADAADPAVDISSFAPRDPNVIVRQIELNVAIKQYEKVLMELHEARLESEIGPPETGLTDEDLKRWKARAERKLKNLEVTANALKTLIRELLGDANNRAREFEKAKAGGKAEPKADESQPKREPLGGRPSDSRNQRSRSASADSNEAALQARADWRAKAVT